MSRRETAILAAACAAIGLAGWWVGEIALAAFMSGDMGIDESLLLLYLPAGVGWILAGGLCGAIGGRCSASLLALSCGALGLAVTPGIRLIIGAGEFVQSVGVAMAIQSFGVAMAIYLLGFYIGWGIVPRAGPAWEGCPASSPRSPRQAT